MVIESEANSPGPAQEQMIDVGGHKLYFRSRGVGEPVVILESGAGGTTGTLHWLEQEIATFTRVCSYDRAGLGRSELASPPSGYRNSIAELHTLLEKAGVKGPYVLVGHSIGGILIREFTQAYPDEVAGLVFIDSSHPYQMEHFPKMMKFQSRLVTLLFKVPPVAKFLMRKLMGKELLNLPPEIQDEMANNYYSDKNFKGLKSEYEDVDAYFVRSQRLNLGSLGDRPIAVFSATEPKAKYMNAWHKLQGEIAALSTNSAHKLVAGATHIGLITHKEFALEIAGAVRKMVEGLNRAK